MKPIFIFETHPVQYRAPVYAELQKLKPDSFRVIYASDCSVRGHLDREFQQKISWDSPLLQGYPFTVLHNERGEPLTTWNSLSGRGIFGLLKKERPRAILLCQFNYAFSAGAYLSALLLRIPIWIRMETQDSAFKRPPWKTALRGSLYRIFYKPVTQAFYIGKRNQEHLLKHGFRPGQLTRSPYCVASSLPQLTDAEKNQRRKTLRASLQIPPDAILAAFVGKLIPKKNPDLLIHALLRLPNSERERFHLLYIGAGELEAQLKQLCASHQVHAHFAGFVNQSQIGDYYLAADQLVLPSRFAGETWGLVVNEALHAGCGVIVSEAVGCAAEFGDWERVRVIPVDDADQCAAAMRDLSKFPRSFDWCASGMEKLFRQCGGPGLASLM